jgi:hypothetical protein
MDRENKLLILEPRNENMFMQVIEELEDFLMQPFDWKGKLYHEDIYAIFGKDSKKLYGFKVSMFGKVRYIYFNDIDRIEQIAKTMKGEEPDS